MADVNADLFDNGVISGFADAPSLHVKLADFFASPVYDGVALKGIKTADFFSTTAPDIINVEYKMRGYNTVLMKQVFWTSLEVDADASDYTTPGDILLSTIVVFRVKGA